MLNLRKISLKLRKTSANPYEFSPKNILRRVKNKNPHDKYIAEALLNYLKDKWERAFMSARAEGDAVKSQEYYDKLKQYDNTTFDNPEQLRTLFKNDEFWPLPFEADPNKKDSEAVTGIPSKSDNEIMGVPRKHTPFKRYDLDSAQKKWQSIIDDAVQLESRGIKSTLAHLIDNALRQKGIHPNTEQPFEGPLADELRHEGVKLPEVYSVTEDDYQEFINEMMDNLMNSNMLFKGRTQFNEPFDMNTYEQHGQSPENLYGAFQNYIDKITPIFWKSYSNEFIMKPLIEIEHPISLNEEVPNEFGVLESLMNQFEDPNALKDIETGKGVLTPELDVLSGLQQLERMAEQPIEDYTNSNQFKLQSLIQMLKPFWEQKVQELSGPNSTPEMKQEAQKYIQKLDMSNNSKIAPTPGSVDTQDLNLLGIDSSQVLPIIEDNKDKFLAEILWNKVLEPSGSPITEKTQFLNTFNDILTEHQETGESFDEMLNALEEENNRSEGYIGDTIDDNQEDTKSSEAKDFVSDALSRITEQYGESSKLKELLELTLSIFNDPEFLARLREDNDRSGEDIADLLGEKWNLLHPDKPMTVKQINKFLDEIVKGILDEVRQEQKNESFTDKPIFEPAVVPKPISQKPSPTLLNPQLLRKIPGDPTGFYYADPSEEENPVEDPVVVEEFRKLLESQEMSKYYQELDSYYQELDSQGLSLRKKIKLSLRKKIGLSLRKKN